MRNDAARTDVSRQVGMRVQHRSKYPAHITDDTTGSTDGRAQATRHGQLGSSPSSLCTYTPLESLRPARAPGSTDNVDT